MQETRRYQPAEIEALTHAVLTDGFCVLPQHFALSVLDAWREAFAPLLEQHIAQNSQRENRGVQRYYVTLPFVAPFAEETVWADADILAIVQNLVGQDFVMCQLATDTPLRGSDYQDVHRDAPPLFPEWGRETPPFQLAVNFPLVDVTPENGPFEVVRGTHLLSKEEGLKQLTAGAVELEPILLRCGDVLIRDVRGLHRGTPNRSATPRPMCVIGYSRKWLLRPEVMIHLPRAVWEQLSSVARQMLRFNRIVETLDDAPQSEIYQSFSY